MLQQQSFHCRYININIAKIQKFQIQREAIVFIFHNF